MTKNNWFEVDRAGLAQLIEERGKGSLLTELISNAWDAPGVTTVRVELWAVENAPFVDVSIEDDSPAGFIDLEHAWTLFAPSDKKTRPEVRGRFNLGEKLVLALCTEARIESTTGTVTFNESGRRRYDHKRPCGTKFYGHMRMKREELRQIARDLRLLNGPKGVATSVLVHHGGDREHCNERQDLFEITRRNPIKTLRVTLPTPLADEQGVLRLRGRETTVEVFADLEVDGARPGVLHEMGVPVVEIGGPWHVNVMQKVPLNQDRDNVPPTYLRQLRTAVLDVMADELTPETACAKWVTEGMAAASPDTLSSVLDLRFGEKRVAYDPSDPEANKRATAAGYAVVPGGALPGDVWANVRETGTIKPAGQVMPTKHPRFSPDGIDTEIPRDKWTEAQVLTIAALRTIADVLLHERVAVPVRLVRDPSNRFAAWYARGGHLTLNLQVLGHRWFEDGADGLQVKHLDLLLHELGHEFCDDHLSDDYTHAVTRLGAQLAMHLCDDPKLRRRLQRKAAV